MSFDITYQYRHYVRPYLKDPKRKAYSFLGITLTAIVLLGAFAIRPALTTIFSLRKEVKDLRDIDQRLNQKIGDLSTSQTQYKTNKDSLYLFDVALPDQPEIAEMIDVINTLNGKSGVTLKTFNVFEDGSDRSGLKRHTIQITINGDYEKLIRFLTLLEIDLRQTKVSRLEIAKRGDDPAGIVETTISFEFFNLQK